MIRNRTFNSLPAVIHFNGKNRFMQEAEKYARQIMREPWWRGEPLNKDLQIFSVSDSEDLMLFRQLREAGIPYTRLDPPKGKRFNCCDRLPIYREAAKNTQAKYVMCLDASDLVFQRHPNTLLRDFCKDFEVRGVETLVSAEQGKWPPDFEGVAIFEEALGGRQLLHGRFPYANAGALIGLRHSVVTLMHLATAIDQAYTGKKWPTNDQAAIRAAAMILYPKVIADSGCRIFQSMNDVWSQVLEMVGDPRPRTPKPEVVSIPTTPVANHNDKVSCLCVTHRRADLLTRAIRCFEAQTWPNRELVVVYREDDHETLAVCKQALDREVPLNLVGVSPQKKPTLGELRNLSVQRAIGEWVMVWDDDDWHHPQRIIEQYNAATSQDKPACVLNRVCLYDVPEKSLRVSRSRRWEQTLLCRRDVMPEYKHLERREDRPVVDHLQVSGSLTTLDKPGLYCYVWHGRNVNTHDHFKGASRGADAIGPGRRDMLATVPGTEVWTLKAPGDVEEEPTEVVEVPEKERPRPLISYCITCKGRLSHLMETLPATLKIHEEQDDVEFVLVDYDCPENCGGWAEKALLDYIKSGQLRIRYVVDEPVYRPSHAKNVAHRLGRGQVLVNLDADNVAIHSFTECVRKNMVNHDIMRWSGEGAWGGGGGRIAVQRAAFYALGGYDEGMTGWGGDDDDLFDRARAMGLRCWEGSPGLLKFIEHDDRLRTQFMPDHKKQNGKDNINKQRSARNIKQGQLVANMGNEWGYANYAVVDL
jgi:hypothetical protein